MKNKKRKFYVIKKNIIDLGSYCNLKGTFDDADFFVLFDYLKLIEELFNDENKKEIGNE